MRFAAFLTLAGLVLSPLLYAAQAPGGAADALLILDKAPAASDRGFRRYLADNGARIVHSYPPHAYIGHIPRGLDAVLAYEHGAAVYREKIADTERFEKYGENASLAVAVWNRRFTGEAPAAPRTGPAAESGNGGDIVLSWEPVMKAYSYRLQIAGDEGFSRISLDTALSRNVFKVSPAFFPEGTYYWRASAVLTLNTGENLAGPFSDIRSFSVSKPRRAAARAPLPAPPRTPDSRLKKGVVSWAPVPAADRYRLQISSSADFASPLVDVFTERAGYKLSSLPLARETTYYMRIMGSDGSSAGPWSEASRIVLETPAPIPNDVRRPLRRRAR